MHKHTKVRSKRKNIKIINTINRNTDTIHKNGSYLNLTDTNSLS